jgi:hypothetical protein
LGLSGLWRTLDASVVLLDDQETSGPVQWAFDDQQDAENFRDFFNDVQFAFVPRTDVA